MSNFNLKLEIVSRYKVQKMNIKTCLICVVAFCLRIIEKCCMKTFRDITIAFFLLAFSTNTLAEGIPTRFIYNGDFEQPTIQRDCGNWTFAFADQDHVNGWQTNHIDVVTAGCGDPGNGIIEFWKNQHINNVPDYAQVTPTYSGNQFIELNGDNYASTVYQELCMLPGESMGYSFLHHARRHWSEPMDVINTIQVGLRRNNTFTEIDSDTLSVILADQWFLHQGALTNITGQTDGYLFSLQSLKNNHPEIGNMVDNVAVDIPPLIEVVGFSSNSVAESEVRTHLLLHVNGILDNQATLTLRATAANTANFNVDYRIATGSLDGRGFIAQVDEVREEVTLTLPAGTYDPNQEFFSSGVQGIIKIPILLIDDALPEVDTTLAFELVSVDIGGGASVFRDLAINDANCDSVVQRSSSLAVLDDDSIPRVRSLTTGDTTPSLQGTVPDVGVDSFSVTVNDVTYPLSNPALSVNADGTWQLDIPAANALNSGVYEVTARIVDAQGNIIEDTSADELVVIADANPSIGISELPTATQNNEDVYPVSGTCIDSAGDVRVSIVGASLSARTTSCNNGIWATTFDVSDVPDGDNVLRADATQTADNGDVLQAIPEFADKDTVAPEVTVTFAPTATPSNQANYVVAGTCIAGAGEVRITIPNAIPQQQTVSCTNDGRWLAITDVTPLPEGVDVIEVLALQTDENGNASVPARANADKDLGPPWVGISDLDTGLDNTYDSREDDAVTISGTTEGIEPGQTVAVEITDGTESVFVNATVLDNGSWVAPAVDLSQLADGPLEVHADASNLAGKAAQRASRLPMHNTSSESDDLPFIAITDDGSFGDNQVMGEEANTLTVRGLTTGVEPGQVVTVNFTDLNGTTVHTSAIVAADGSWQARPLDVSGLASGSIAIAADVSDQDSNAALTANDAVILVGPAADFVSINEPVEANPDNESNYPLSGLCSDNNATVRVTVIGASPSSQSVVCANGQWQATVDVSPLSPGDDAVEVTAVQLDDNSLPNAIALDEANKIGPDVDPDQNPGPGDQVPNVLSGIADSDNDGIPDALEGSGDTDGDGTPDYLDTDSDNDGIPDANEAENLPPLSGNDSDNDGVDDALDPDFTGGVDADGDGIDDALAPQDTDGDGTPDFQDLDSDNDGIPDAIEGDQDTDNDGVPDYRDLDSDNDGIPDLIEFPLLLGTDRDNDGVDDAFDPDFTQGPDLNNDGIDDSVLPAVLNRSDTDNDGIPDFQDVDSDDDGIPDAVEAGDINEPRGTDSDGDGIDDAFDVDNTGGRDQDGNGIDDLQEPLDTDQDGIPDYQQLDSDRDGILDTIEADIVAIDRDGDGIIDQYDVDVTGGIDVDQDGVDDRVKPTDTDNDGTPDYHDLDSDNDGLKDVVEAGLSDINNDGLRDNSLLALLPLPDADRDGSPDFRDIDRDDAVIPTPTPIPNINDGNDPINNRSDTDGDGIPDSLDLDDDNDGIPDIAEYRSGRVTDSDGDGIFDHLDKDSDNDGIPDAIEAGHGVEDLDQDGVLDELLDFNNDGLDDRIDENFVAIDTDDDRWEDFRDLDSDGDTLTDLMETSLGDLEGDDQLDVDGDGRIDTVTDTDRDGLADRVDPSVSGIAGLSISVDIYDTDRNGVPNFLSLDSDGDSFTDDIENADFDGNGVNDRLENQDQLITAINGRGGASMDILSLSVVLLALLLTRSSVLTAFGRKYFSLFLLGITLLTVTGHDASAHGLCGYAYLDNPDGSKENIQQLQDRDADYKKKA